jgi:hypothetical protein
MEHLTQAVPASIVEGWGRIMPWLDIGAIAVFGISGALAAAQMRKTLVTFMFLPLLPALAAAPCAIC